MKLTEFTDPYPLAEAVNVSHAKCSCLVPLLKNAVQHTVLHSLESDHKVSLLLSSNSRVSACYCCSAAAIVGLYKAWYLYTANCKCCH